MKIGVLAKAIADGLEDNEEEEFTVEPTEKLHTFVVEVVDGDRFLVELTKLKPEDEDDEEDDEDEDDDEDDLEDEDEDDEDTESLDDEDEDD